MPTAQGLEVATSYRINTSMFANAHKIGQVYLASHSAAFCLRKRDKRNRHSPPTAEISVIVDIAVSNSKEEGKMKAPSLCLEASFWLPEQGLNL